MQHCGTGWLFLSIEAAVEEALRRRAIGRDIDETTAEELLWRSAWLPFARNRHGGIMFVDGRAPSDPPRTPVFYTEAQMGTQVPPPAPSLGQVVTWWIEAMDAKIIDYDSTAGKWRYDIDARDQVDRTEDRAVGRGYLV